jgi:hypothetical protein
MTLNLLLPLLLLLRMMMKSMTTACAQARIES